MAVELFEYDRPKKLPPTSFGSLNRANPVGTWVAKMDGRFVVVEISLSKNFFMPNYPQHIPRYVIIGSTDTGVPVVTFMGTDILYVFGVDTFDIKLIRRIKLS